MTFHLLFNNKRFSVKKIGASRTSAIQFKNIFIMLSQAIFKLQVLKISHYITENKITSDIVRVVGKLFLNHVSRTWKASVLKITRMTFSGHLAL